MALGVSTASGFKSRTSLSSPSSRTKATLTAGREPPVSAGVDIVGTVLLGNRCYLLRGRVVHDRDRHLVFQAVEAASELSGGMVRDDHGMYGSHAHASRLPLPLNREPTRHPDQQKAEHRRPAYPVDVDKPMRGGRE